jgi:RHS repeat-associated protein
MLDLGDRGYSYTKHNRLFEVFDHGLLKATYQYNGLGQRISKTLPDGSGKYFIYDTDGKLMAETDINGNVLFEYIYLNGQLLAKYSPDSDSDGISNAEEEHLGTNPLSPDSDNDGLADLAEMFVHGTSVSNADTDADGVSDGEEVSLNSDPLNVNIAIGDINLDGKLNLGDYVLLSQYVLDIRIPTPTEQAQADINQDGVLNIQDMLLMQRTLLGLQISSSDFSADNIERIFAELYQGIIPPAYAAVGDGQIYYVHNDHLGTPMKMTNAMGLVVWQAMYDPFGKASVNEDVDGDGKAVEMNMRFPGQYYDVESGLHYNYFRDYDSSIGRYIQSDKLDVMGRTNDPLLQMQGFGDDGWFEFSGERYYDGSSIYSSQLNHLYGYAGNNPLKNIDFYGLWYYGGGAGSLGDYFSGPNGNVSPGFTQQDYVCSSVACVLNPFPSMVKRCIAHDKCYENNKCNSSSWISNALGGTKSCNECNSNF